MGWEWEGSRVGFLWNCQDLRLEMFFVDERSNMLLQQMTCFIQEDCTHFEH